MNGGGRSERSCWLDDIIGCLGKNAGPCSYFSVDIVPNPNQAMDTPKKIGFDLNYLAEAFDLERVQKSADLDEWLTAQYELNSLEASLFESIYSELQEDGDYWNEEELKIQFIGLAFRIAGVTVKNRIKVFYERPLSALVNGYDLAVISDCLVATPRPFHAPKNPYFFLQEFKKKRGDKKDPEAQMLTAMLIGQALNQDGLPVYGGFLFGSNWQFATLVGKQYCHSRQFDATNRTDLFQIIFVLRRLKEIIVNRA